MRYALASILALFITLGWLWLALKWVAWVLPPLLVSSLLCLPRARLFPRLSELVERASDRLAAAWTGFGPLRLLW